MKYPHCIGLGDENSFEGVLEVMVGDIVFLMWFAYPVNLILTGMMLQAGMINMGVFFAENIAFVLSCVLGVAFTNCKGYYLDEEGVYRRRFLKKRIDPKKIKGIKVTKIAIKKVKNDFFGTEYLTPMQDEDGNYVYCMILLNTVYEDMRTYNVHDYSFRREYHECIMHFTGYDLPAINRLRELNPDLIVMYEE